MTGEEVGLDGGENAPWRRSTLDRIFGETIDSGSRLLFGQEKRTVTCEINGGDTIPRGCEEKVAELEAAGRTENWYSGSETGAHSKYGLKGGERVRGTDPTDLDEGQRAEVMIVIQPEEKGIVDKVVDHGEAAIEEVFGYNDGDNESEEDSTGGSDYSSTDSGQSYSQSSVSGGRSGLQSTTGLGSQSTLTSGGSNPDEPDSTDGPSELPERYDRGLIP